MLRCRERFAYVLFLIVLLFGMPLYARADMGAKPSITLTVINAPSDYYVALLGYREQSGSVNAPLTVADYDEASVEAYLRDFCLDGWMYSISPVGTNLYHVRDDGTYYFSYSVPRPFRVILIAEDGSVRVSDSMDQKEFSSDCTYDVSSGTVTENRAEKTANRIGYVVLCYVLTILIELFMLGVFSYPFRRRNIIHFFVINTITQISLNCFLADSPRGIAFLFFCVLAEIAIMVAEGIYFGLTLSDRDGNKRFGKGFLYGITANMVSALAGIVYSTFFAYVFRIME